MFRVQAKENSVSTNNGVEIGTFNRGEMVQINSEESDIWDINANNRISACNALGITENRLPISGKSQVYNAGALVLSIDNGTTFFPVGFQINFMALEDQTTVKLYCWDINSEENGGWINVQVNNN
jgi:hypothetical protein